MQTRPQLFDRISTLFAYPPPGYRAAVEDVQAAFKAISPAAAVEMDAFAAGLDALEGATAEELFTRTFDLNPECCCEVGWHLFGERYDRGSFMVWMREQLRVHEVPESGELPDHLVHVLRVMGRMDQEEAQRFATEAVTPTLERMIKSVKDEDNPFRHLIAAVSAFLVAEFGAPKWRCEAGAWGPQEAAVAQGREE
jgi:nitrate reductase delta subunit